MDKVAPFEILPELLPDLDDLAEVDLGQTEWDIKKDFTLPTTIEYSC